MDLALNAVRGPIYGQHADHEFFHLGPTHEEALARLHYLVENPRGLGLLLGDGGSGKTLLLDRFARRQRRGGRQAAVVNMLGLSGGLFLWRLAAALRTAAPADSRPLSLWRNIELRLEECAQMGLDTVLLLDDADEAKRGALADAARLAVVGQAARWRLAIVLAANGQRHERLGRRLLELCGLRIELERWDAAETAACARAATAAAGGPEGLFEPAALAQLFALTQGVPRRVVRLVELARVAAAGQGLPSIDAATVAAVQRELCPAG